MLNNKFNYRQFIRFISSEPSNRSYPFRKGSVDNTITLLDTIGVNWCNTFDDIGSMIRIAKSSIISKVDDSESYLDCTTRTLLKQLKNIVSIPTDSIPQELIRLDLQVLQLAMALSSPINNPREQYLDENNFNLAFYIKHRGNDTTDFNDRIMEANLDEMMMYDTIYYLYQVIVFIAGWRLGVFTGELTPLSKVTNTDYITAIGELNEGNIVKLVNNIEGILRADESYSPTTDHHCTITKLPYALRDNSSDIDIPIKEIPHIHSISIEDKRKLLVKGLATLSEQYRMEVDNSILNPDLGNDLVNDLNYAICETLVILRELKS